MTHQETHTSTLKPCPFCGEQPRTQDYRSESDESGEVYGYAAAECLHGDSGGIYFHCETLAEAITAWNHRPREDELVEALEGARDTLRSAIGAMQVLGHPPKYGALAMAERTVGEIEALTKHKGAA